MQPAKKQNSGTCYSSARKTQGVKIMSETDKNILDQEQLKSQEELSEAQEKAILSEVLKERALKESGSRDSGKSSWDLHLEREKAKEGGEDEGNNKDADASNDDSEESDDEDDNTDEGNDEEGEDTGENSEEDQEGESEEEKEKRAEEEATKKEQEEQSAGEDIETEITKYAEANGIDEPEAREIIEGVNGIVKKYGDDKKKIAFAYRNLQSHTSKVDEENRSIKKEVEYLNHKIGETSLFPKTVTLEGKEYSVDEFQQIATESYREEHPDKTDDLEDSEVWKMAYREIEQKMTSLQADKQRETNKHATKKRIEFISTLTASHQRFLTDVKPMLDKMSDIQLLNPKFTLDDLILLAKGKHYDEDLKKAKEKEYKKGTEQAKILGEKKSVAKGSSIKTKTKKSVLSNEDLTRAKNMFGGAGLTEEKIIEFYNDFVEKRKKIDKKNQ